MEALLWILAIMFGPALIEQLITSRGKSKTQSHPSNNIAPVNSGGVVVSPKNSWDGDIDGKMVTPGSSWDLLRKQVLRRDGYRCTNCGLTSNLSVDHRVPLSLGGANSLSNLTTLCRDCHEHKDQRKIFDSTFDAKDNYGQDHKLTRKVKILSDAINSGGRVAISYTDYGGKKTTRTISPKRLVKNRGRIYCIAFCYLRDDGRTFRLSRMEI